MQTDNPLESRSKKGIEIALSPAFAWASFSQPLQHENIAVPSLDYTANDLKGEFTKVK
jgi:hypothetical protein